MQPIHHTTTHNNHHLSHILIVFTSHYWIRTILYLPFSFNYSLANQPLSLFRLPKTNPTVFWKVVGSWEAVDSDSWQPFSWVFWVYSFIESINHLTALIIKSFLLVLSWTLKREAKIDSLPVLCPPPTEKVRLSGYLRHLLAGSLVLSSLLRPTAMIPRTRQHSFCHLMPIHPSRKRWSYRFPRSKAQMLPHSKTFLRLQLQSQAFSRWGTRLLWEMWRILPISVTSMNHQASSRVFVSTCHIDFNISSVLHAIATRYMQHLPYTYSGIVLVSEGRQEVVSCC